MESLEKIPCKIVYYDGKTNIFKNVVKSVPIKVWNAFKDQIYRTLINRVWDSDLDAKSIEYCNS
ncbi:MAG: hypothetical protein GF353_01665 [Candidatus Lokiarchaeota archaeon]|nr:hypothetical protein [Candidatus Lokiarchaeota archaeon]